MKRRSFGNRSNRSRDEELLVGTHPIDAWLDAKPSRLRRLFYDVNAAGRLQEVLSKARQQGVELVGRNRVQLSEMAGTPQHQGLVATCAPFPYSALEEVLATKPALVVATDHIQDPQNLGAIMRSAEAAGAAAVILPEDRAASISPAVEMAAAGAAPLIAVIRVVNLKRALLTLQKHGYWVTTLISRGGTDLFTFSAPSPLVLVVGGEVGVHDLVQKTSDFLITIPLGGRSESLNASVATAVALFEIRRRWGKP